MDAHNEFFDLVAALARKRYGIAEQELVSLSLNHIDAQLLNLLSENDGCKQDILSSAVLIDRSNVGRSLKRLEQRGYLERFTDEDDKRAFRVFITAEGAALEKRIAKVKENVMRRLCKNLSKKDARVVVDIIKSSIFPDQ